MSSNPHLKNSGIMDQYKSQFGQDIDIDQFDRLKRERGTKSRKNQRRRKNKTLNKSARQIQSMVRGRQTRSLRNKLKRDRDFDPELITRIMEESMYGKPKMTESFKNKIDSVTKKYDKSLEGENLLKSELTDPKSRWRKGELIHYDKMHRYMNREINKLKKMIREEIEEVGHNREDILRIVRPYGIFTINDVYNDSKLTSLLEDYIEESKSFGPDPFKIRSGKDTLEANYGIESPRSDDDDSDDEDFFNDDDDDLMKRFNELQAKDKLDEEAKGRFDDQKYYLEHEQLLKNKTGEVDKIRKYKDVIEKEFERKQKLNLFKCKDIKAMALADRTLFKDRDFLENKIKPCKINLTRVYIDTFYDIDFNLIIPRMGMSITEKLDSLEDAGTFDDIGVEALKETLKEMGILSKDTSTRNHLVRSEYATQPFNNLVLLSNFYRLAKSGQTRELRHLVTRKRNDERTRRGLMIYPGVVPTITGEIILLGDQYFTDVSGKDALGFTLDFFKEKYIDSYTDTYGYSVPVPFDNIEKMKRYFILVLLGFDDYYNYMFDLDSLIDTENRIYKRLVSSVGRAKEAIDESLRLQRESINIDEPIISKEYSDRYTEAIGQAKLSKATLEEYEFHKLNMEKYFDYKDEF
jgi:hypothetical protein